MGAVCSCYIGLIWTFDVYLCFLIRAPFWCSPPFPWGQLSPLEHLTLLQLRARGLAPSTLICKASPAQNKDAIPHISCMQYWKSIGTQTNVGWEGGGSSWNNWVAAALSLTGHNTHPTPNHSTIPSTKTEIVQLWYPKPVLK